MGLDLVELSLDVEGRFNVNLSQDWSSIRTMGDLNDAVCRQLTHQHEQASRDVCPSIAPFLSVRQALMDTAICQRGAVRPSAVFSELVEPARRRRIWFELQDRTQIRLPELIVIPEEKRWMFQVSLAALVLVAMLAGSRSGIEDVVVFGLIPVLLVPICYFLTRPLAVVVPKECRTVGDIVRHANAMRYASKATANDRVDPDEVWPELVAIVADVLDVPVGDLQRTSRFVEDLRCN